MHGVVGPLGDAEHDLQAVLDLPLALLTAGQELLARRTQPSTRGCMLSFLITLEYIF